MRNLFGLFFEQKWESVFRETKVVFSIFFFSGLFALQAKGQFNDIVEHKIVGTSDASNSVAAKAEIISEVSREISLKYILDLIGNAKYKANKAVVDNQILSESGRYIPLLKTGSIKSIGGKYQMLVRLSLSQKNLRSLLLENGLLYQNQGRPKMYPFITIRDKIHNKSYSWWELNSQQAPTYLKKIMNSSEKAIAAEFEKEGFYLLPASSANFGEGLPDAFREGKLREQDVSFITKYLKMQSYIIGEIVIDRAFDRIDAFRIQSNWKVKFNSNGRIMAEVSRGAVTDSGSFDTVLKNTYIESFAKTASALTDQLKAAWQKGTFGANLYQVVLKGVMDYEQLEVLKSNLNAKARYIKGLRERKFSPGEIILEADMTASIDRLAEIVSQQRIGSLAFGMSEISNNKAVFNIQGSSQSPL